MMESSIHDDGSCSIVCTMFMKNKVVRGVGDYMYLLGTEQLGISGISKFPMGQPNPTQNVYCTRILCFELSQYFIKFLVNFSF